MLTLKLQYFGPLMRRADSFEKTLMLGKIEGRRRKGWQRMRWLDGITQCTWVWVSSGSWWWTGEPGLLQSMGLQRVGHDWATELNWIPGIYEGAGGETGKRRKQTEHPTLGPRAHTWDSPGKWSRTHLVAGLPDGDTDWGNKGHFLAFPVC